MTLNCEKINLKKGSKGNEVKEVQKYLTWLGLYTAKVDGEYGNLTLEAVKKLQKRYNLVTDGIYGKITCNKCGINGQDISNSIQTIDNTTFKDMITRYNMYIKAYNKEPQILYLEITNKYRYITLAKYKDMKNRWDKFIKENGRESKLININIANTTPGTTSEDKEFINKFSEAVGKKITTFKEGCDAIKNRKYLGYNNDIYSQKVALERLKNKKGLNCSDISQLLHRLAKAFGLEVHYVHLKCKSGTGHIIIKVRKKGTSSWTWVDGAAMLSSGKAYGQGWCYNGKVICEDDKWLLSDDGIT